MASILLIDDDDQFRAMLTEILTDAGHQVQAVTDGSQATRVYVRHQTDLVITDLVMPNKDGVEVILELKRLNAAAKIIAMSGGGRHGSESYLKVAHALGAQRVLAKPFSREELLEAVRRSLDGT